MLDQDGDGQITPCPPPPCRDVEELRTMLDQDGDGQITYEELLATIKEATEASGCGRGQGGRPEL